MIQACLNGGRSKKESSGIPITPEDLAIDACQALHAGAKEFHIHPRAQDSCESLYPDDVGACLRAIRTAVPNIPVGVGTGAWIKPGNRERLPLIRDWTELPDYASVNLNEIDAFENMELLSSKGIGIEAGIWNKQDAERFVASDFTDKTLRILIEMAPGDPATAKVEYETVIAVLKNSNLELPILLHGQDESAWAMVRLALAKGHDTRVGFEDMLILPNGQMAKSNTEIVRAANSLYLSK